MANEQKQNTQSGTSAQPVREEDFSTSSINSAGLRTSGASSSGSVEETTKDAVNQAKETAKEMASEAKDTAKEVVSQTAKNVAAQAKEGAGQIYDTAAEKTKSTIQEQKSNFASSLSSVADSLKKAGEEMRSADDEIGITNVTAKYGDTLAQQIEQISRYFETKDLREIARDVESFARRNPGVFIGSAFALGFLAARFLKSSSSSTPEQSFTENRPGMRRYGTSAQTAGGDFNEANSLNPGEERPGDNPTTNTVSNPY